MKLANLSKSGWSLPIGEGVQIAPGQMSDTIVLAPGGMKSMLMLLISTHGLGVAVIPNQAELSLLTTPGTSVPAGNIYLHEQSAESALKELKDGASLEEISAKFSYQSELDKMSEGTIEEAVVIEPATSDVEKIDEDLGDKDLSEGESTSGELSGLENSTNATNEESNANSSKVEVEDNPLKEINSGDEESSTKDVAKESNSAGNTVPENDTKREVKTVPGDGKVVDTKKK